MKKSPHESRTEMRMMMFPSDANPKGNVFGGVILKHVDLVAGIVEKRHELEQLKKNTQDEITQLRKKMEDMKLTLTTVKSAAAKGRSKWDAIMEEGEIEIVVAREKPDGTSLYRELLAAMNAKPVFYLKAIVGTNGKDFTAIQAML